MSLVYRSIAFNNKVAELVVDGPENIICVLTDKTLRTEDRIRCCDIRYAERLVEQFLRTENPYYNQ